MDFEHMHIGEDYAWAGKGLIRRVTLLPTNDDLRAKEQANVRICEGAREGEIKTVSIHDLIYHWQTGKQDGGPARMPREKPPGVRRSSGRRWAA